MDEIVRRLGQAVAMLERSLARQQEPLHHSSGRELDVHPAEESGAEEGREHVRWLVRRTHGDARIRGRCARSRRG